MTQLTTQAIDLLKQLISTPSFSGKEEETAGIIRKFLNAHNIPTWHYKNNLWSANKHFDPAKPTLLLNSHHDTVKPNEGYSRDPFTPAMEDGKLFGLGSNDAGGPLVSLIAAFIHFYERQDLSFNLLFAASAEEEISGKNGIASILDKLPAPDCAIVGEPTQMNMAVAEKGLMVLDCIARGKSGHAARSEGENAIYNALRDIEWFKSYRFEEVSEFLGPVKMTTTLIEAGSQHNVVPDQCRFTVDVRTTDIFNNEEVLKIIRKNTVSEINPRSTRLNSSSIATDHPIIQAGQAIGLATYGSPTLSDQALLPVPSLKIGPGESCRSHSADEFIRLDEIEKGIVTYINLINRIAEDPIPKHTNTNQ